MQADGIFDCGVSMAGAEKAKTRTVPEPLNRGLPVTDKGRGAWQNRCHPQMRGPKSVCRELPRMALAA